eukprot:SAG25_NODE_75_length_16951_cov_86.523208_21_plen_133_part_00
MCEPVCFDIMEMIGTEYQKLKETQKNKKMYGEIVTHLKEYFNLFLEDAKYITGDPYGEPSSWKYEVVDEYNIAEMRGALLYCEMLKDGNTTCDYRFLDHNDLWNTNHAKVIKQKGGEDYFTFMLSHPKWYDL